jgi:hypothetical protein
MKPSTMRKQENVAGALGVPVGKKFAVNEAAYTPFGGLARLYMTWPVPPDDEVLYTRAMFLLGGRAAGDAFSAPPYVGLAPVVTAAPDRAAPWIGLALAYVVPRTATTARARKAEIVRTAGIRMMTSRR